MNLSKYEAAASGTPPSAPASPSTGYPTDGNPATPVPATVPGEYWFYQQQAELNNVLTTAGLTPDHTNLTQLAAAIAVIAGNALAKVALVIDSKTAGSSGGTFTLGAWRQRDLNTIVFDPSSIVSVSSNQFTLGAGKYLVRVRAPAASVNGHMARLYNVTDSAVVNYGSSENTQDNVADVVTTWSTVIAYVNIAGSKTFRVEHFAEKTFSTSGFGQTASTGAAETYTQVEIVKLS